MREGLVGDDSTNVVDLVSSNVVCMHASMVSVLCSWCDAKQMRWSQMRSLSPR